MTHLVRPFVELLAFNDFFVNTVTRDLDDDLARRRVRDGGPSIAWTLGHLLKNRAQMADAVGGVIRLERASRIGATATDGRDYPLIRQLREEWQTASTLLVSALGSRTDDDLTRDLKGTRLPHGERRPIDALRFYVWHETYHCGHIGLIRTHFGLQPVAALVAAATSPSPTSEVEPQARAGIFEQI